MIFEFRNEILTITPQGAIIPEVKSVKELTNHKDVLEYVFFVYDRNSIYHNMLISDRKKIVHNDRFIHLKEEDFVQLESTGRELIDKLNKVQYTPNERLIESMNGKIDEYIIFWQSIKIDKDSHKLASDTLERAENLLKMKEKIDKLVAKESSSRQMGGAQAKMFE